MLSVLHGPPIRGRLWAPTARELAGHSGYEVPSTVIVLLTQGIETS